MKMAVTIKTLKQNPSVGFVSHKTTWVCWLSLFWFKEIWINEACLLPFVYVYILLLFYMYIFLKKKTLFCVSPYLGSGIVQSEPKLPCVQHVWYMRVPCHILIKNTNKQETSNPQAVDFVATKYDHAND